MRTSASDGTGLSRETRRALVGNVKRDFGDFL
jgi:hypothetical protein